MYDLSYIKFIRCFHYFMKYISLIIPAKNESLSLGEVLKELKKFKIVNEIIVVVDSKEDNSIQICKDNNCKYLIQKKEGMGQQL